MTNKEVKKTKQELCEIQAKPASEEQLNQIVDIARRVGASIPPYLLKAGEEITTKNNINTVASNIHVVLQTEMMFNTCIFAKHSCFWAAIAAIAACISVILVLFCG
jgi:hypothetical protein